MSSMSFFATRHRRGVVMNTRMPIAGSVARFSVQTRRHAFESRVVLSLGVPGRIELLRSGSRYRTVQRVPRKALRLKRPVERLVFFQPPSPAHNPVRSLANSIHEGRTAASALSPPSGLQYGFRCWSVVAVTASGSSRRHEESSGRHERSGSRHEESSGRHERSGDRLESPLAGMNVGSRHEQLWPA